MAYWVKILYDRKKYVVNFDRVNVFCYESNGRITFWLPDSAIPIVLNRQNNLEDYEELLEHIKYLTGLELENPHWIKIIDERKEYIINLTCISSFCQEANGRLTFWLPDASIPIIINPLSNPECYQKVLRFVEKSTGYSLF
ncbi:hypothetical protein NWP17_17260 [Chrysosporum bergii ANA360D]|uniref:Uncharacterized protein n=1 Tax=Chrysosporum bergii ANA360D TaxID=617107 RepID=A0AA43GVK3_9CYAN|nr:hypothetical protein [Chrysosporum bergii]MDH6062161.1 hypothetical protein [Chrysosporum bergii ANA360D]